MKMDAETYMVNMKSNLETLALGAMWQLILFVPISLICLNAKHWSEKLRFRIALCAGYFLVFITVALLDPLAKYATSKSAYSGISRMTYFDGNIFACILGFMLICFRLRKASGIGKDEIFLMYAQLCFAMTFLLIIYIKLIKWHL